MMMERSKCIKTIAEKHTRDAPCVQLTKLPAWKKEKEDRVPTMNQLESSEEDDARENIDAADRQTGSSFGFFEKCPSRRFLAVGLCFSSQPPIGPQC